MSISDELKPLLEETLGSVKREAERLYSSQPGEVLRADLHYLVHEKLEEVLDRLNLDVSERRTLRREVGRILHLLVAEEKL